jgi:uncharacterized protein YdaU (DUF1376 family)
MMKPPAFQFYVDNFVEGTMEMTDAELGFYVRLLCAQWNRGGLPDDDKELSRFSRGQTPAQLRRALARVKLKFEKKSDGLLKNNRMESEREKQIKFRENRSESGKLGAAKLWHSHSKANPKGMAKNGSPSPSSSPNKDTPAFAGEHKAFIEGWSEAFKVQFGFDYAFIGGRDGKATKELLATGILRIDLLEIAKKAWKNQKSFPCKQATTIHGFQHNFNQIRTELKPVQSNSTITGTVQPHDGRNF